MEIKSYEILVFSVFKQFSLFRHLRQDYNYYTIKAIFTLSKYILHNTNFLTMEFNTVPQMQSTYTFNKLFNSRRFWKR